MRSWFNEGDVRLLNALDEIIARRKARCDDIENKIDKLDDELFKEYLELEFFENKKRKILNNLVTVF